MALNFQKILQLAGYLLIHMFYTKWLSETYHNSEILGDGLNLEILGHNMVRDDHLLNCKNVEVLVYSIRIRCLFSMSMLILKSVLATAYVASSLS